MDYKNQASKFDQPTLWTEKWHRTVDMKWNLISFPNYAIYRAKFYTSYEFFIDKR